MKQLSTKGTSLAITVREELLSYIEAAVQSIGVRAPTDAQIHGARKKLKRARANLRLLRDAVGNSAYSRENTALRDAARPLSGVRDAAVLCETADGLIETSRPGARRRLLLKARRALEQGRLKARAELRVMNAIKESAVSLNAALTRMRKWKLNDVDRAVLRCGLQRTYRQGRQAFTISCADPTDEHLHEWRKQVKYLGQSLKVWKSHGAEQVEDLVTRADKLAELLGTDHDLVVFEQRLEQLDSPHPMLPAITHAITDQRCDLLDKVLTKGRRLFKAKPRSFVRRAVREH